MSKTLEELKQEMDAAWDARAAVYAAAARGVADNAYEDAWDAYAVTRAAYKKRLEEMADENT